MSKGVSLLMAQVDDVPGETLANFVSRAESFGAKNVQLLSSVTKKGRPGYVVLLDVPAEQESEAGLLLGEELGVWGYRVLAAEHRHFDIERIVVAVSLTVDQVHEEIEMRAKIVRADGRRLRVKAEHDDLAAACETLRERGQSVPLAALKSAIETRLYENDTLRAMSVVL